MIAMHTMFEAAKTRVSKAGGGGSGRSADALLMAAKRKYAVITGMKRKMSEKNNINKGKKEALTRKGYVVATAPSSTN